MVIFVKAENKMPKKCPRMHVSPCECRSHNVCIQQFLMTDHQIVVHPIKH